MAGTPACPPKPGAPEAAPVTGPEMTCAALRQSVASLLRLTNGDVQDAQTLLDAGSTRNAARLLRHAVTGLIEAVVASEQGYTGPADTSRISEDNPLKADLLRLDKFPGLAPAMQQDGRLAKPPSTTFLIGPLRDVAKMLDRLKRHFGVDLEGSGQARTADPPRPSQPEPPPPPAAKPQPGAERRKADDAPPPAKAAARARPAARPAKTASPPPAARSHAGLSSGSFWALVDRWKLVDLDALRLIGHAGGLTKKGTRPRFKLTEAEAEAVAAMRSLDETLEQLCLDPAQWLQAPLRPAPFGGAKPIGLILKTRLQGLREASHYLTQMGLRLSLQES